MYNFINVYLFHNTKIWKKKKNVIHESKEKDSSTSNFQQSY